MSYLVPGPGRRDLLSSLKQGRANPVLEAREELELLAAKQAERADTVVAQPASSEPLLGSTEPPDLDRLFTHEQARSSARSANDKTLADRALTEVVGDLQRMLDIAADEVRSSGRGRSRQQVKDAVARLVRTSSLSKLPLRDMAELLDIPPGDVDPVILALTRDGGISPAERHQALEGIEQLRDQLQQVADSKEHSLLDRLLSIIVEIFLLVTIVAVATPLGAVVAGDPVVNEIVKAAVIALVALALQSTAQDIRERRRARDPYTIAANAHSALLEELTAAESLNAAPAYGREHAIIRIRLTVRCCAARVATISLKWTDAQQCWAMLDEIEAAAGARSPELAGLRRKLQVLTPPSG
jgi:hypothetical protein